jgi:hypothetical protein
MRIQQGVPLLLFLICLGGLLPIPGYSADPDRQTLQDLLSELDKAIENADERMVAHPKFL